MAARNEQEQELPGSDQEDITLAALVTSCPHSPVIDHEMSSEQADDMDDTVGQEAMPAPDNPHKTNPVNNWATPLLKQRQKVVERPGFSPIYRIWALEIVSIVFSTLLLVAIIVVLARFDGNSLPEWPLAITLNTLIALLVTVAKAAFMAPVSVAISQGQWGWFLQERPLCDFHVFDQASRGPWGSLMFLKQIHIRHFTSIGAFLMVVSILSSPLTQFAISYPVRAVATAGEANVGLDRVIYRAIYSATTLDITDFSSAIEPQGASCSTGNCTFEIYHSLGVCLKRANISSHLRVERLEDKNLTGLPPLYQNSTGHGNYPFLLAEGGEIWKASLPGGPTLVDQNAFSLITDNLNGGQSIGFQDNEDLLRTKVASIVLIYAKPIMHKSPWEDPNNRDGVTLKMAMDSTDGTQYEALEFLFHTCVQSYQTIVQLGKETTHLIESSARPLDKGLGVFLDLNCTSALDTPPRTCPFNTPRWNDTMYLEAPLPREKGQDASIISDERFEINYYPLEGLAFTLITALQGYEAVSYNPLSSEDPKIAASGQTFTRNLFDSAIFSPRALTNSSERDNRVLNIFTNVATLISQRMRATGSKYSRENVANFTGQAWREESYVRINWGWVSFLTVETVLAAGFLAITIRSQFSQWQSRNKGGALIYEDAKDSSLALLVALRPRSRELMGEGLRPIEELKINAQNLKVKLDGNGVIPAESG